MADSENYGRDGGVYWVRDRETGEKLAVDNDDDFNAALHAFESARCDHPETAMMRVVVKNGATQVRECCVVCGDRRGSAAGQADRAWVAGLPIQPAEHAATYKSRRSEERYRLLLKHGRRQEALRGRLSMNYRRYLASPEWEGRRQKVLKRCGGLCEGCGDAPAVHVHHRTYVHFGAEFLFELVGLCAPCHERIHPDDKE